MEQQNQVNMSSTTPAMSPVLVPEEQLPQRNYSVIRTAYDGYDQWGAGAQQASGSCTCRYLTCDEAFAVVTAELQRKEETIKSQQRTIQMLETIREERIEDLERDNERLIHDRCEAWTMLNTVSSRELKQARELHQVQDERNEALRQLEIERREIAKLTNELQAERRRNGVLLKQNGWLRKRTGGLQSENKTLKNEMMDMNVRESELRMTIASKSEDVMRLVRDNATLRRREMERDCCCEKRQRLMQ